jgi:hypothetical protein
MTEAITATFAREFAAHDAIIRIADECDAKSARRFAIDPRAA